MSWLRSCKVWGRDQRVLLPVARRVHRIAIPKDRSRVVTSDWDQPIVAVIDTITDTVSRPIDVGAIPFATTSTADGRCLWVAENKAETGLEICQEDSGVAQEEVLR
jgi:hypothetical protein